MMFICFSINVALIAQTATDQKPSVIDIGSRLELFVDNYLIDQLNGAHLKLQTPQPAEVVLKFDRPWEGGNSAYFTVIKDGETYWMYYRGSRVEPGTAQFTCYAESPDGISWKRPNLGLFEVEGTRDNNVILTPEVAPVTHNFCPFIDKNPDAPTSERFKAVGGGGSGLYPFVSADGIRWRKLIDDPVILPRLLSVLDL